MIGGWSSELRIGSIVELYDRIGREKPRRAPARVMRVATREEYIAQQHARGVLDGEAAESWSILNTARFFYAVSVD